MTLSENYTENISFIEKKLGFGRNFDVLKRTLTVGRGEITFYFIDGFVKDGELQRIMQFLLGKSEIGSAEACEKMIPYVEISRVTDADEVTRAVLSGQTVLSSNIINSKCCLTASPKNISTKLTR